jgi:hypothetical protein
LQQWNLTDLADDSVLVLSELLTNAVQQRLVAHCTAERWGVVLSPNGKSVWGEVTR